MSNHEISEWDLILEQDQRKGKERMWDLHTNTHTHTHAHTHTHTRRKLEDKVKM